MRNLVIRMIATIAFLGSIYWIYSAPSEVEPYVTALVLLGAAIASFTARKPHLIKEVGAEIWLSAVGLDNLKAGEIPIVVFQYQNIGDAHAYELELRTGIHTSLTKLEEPPPPFVFDIPTPTTILPHSKIMTKNLTFRRAITLEEISEVKSGKMLIYAYSELRYKKSEKNKDKFILKTCNFYNPITTFFQNTSVYDKVVENS
ncbi:MAG: hypothetical protein JKY14_09270 [Paraglaciecola sp.]|nr:hypothetical protein [Paraglaciecola sp.]